MRYGPWPRRGRLLRHLCFSSSFLRCFNPGGSGHVKGARAHRAQRERGKASMTHRFVIRDSLQASKPDKHLAAPSNGFLIPRRCPEGLQ